MVKYIVYRSPYEVPRVTTKEFADQINEDAVIAWTYSIDGAIVNVVKWYQDQAYAFTDMNNDEFKALMGLSDVNK